MGSPTESSGTGQTKIRDTVKLSSLEETKNPGRNGKRVLKVPSSVLSLVVVILGH
jgi:hypothetical protein